MSNRTAERQRATALKAADARAILKARLPLVFADNDAGQVDQVQRFLDSLVVNPAVQKEVDDLDRKSIKSQPDSTIEYRDQDKVRQRDKKKQELIVVKETDRRVRVNHEKLLTSDALKPTTDNPDEAVYLLQVKGALADKGVWLRFATNGAAWIQNANPPIPATDPRRFLIGLWFVPPTMRSRPKPEAWTGKHFSARRSSERLLRMGPPRDDR